MIIDLCEIVRCVTISFLSKYAHIRLFQIFEMCLIALGQLIFLLPERSLGGLYCQLCG